MLGYLDAVVALGLLVVAIQISDLLLSRRQVGWVEARFETLTLQLEYTRPLRLLPRLSEPRVIFAAVLLGCWCYLNWGVFFPQYLQDLGVNTSLFAGIALGIFIPFPIAFATVWVASSTRWQYGAMWLFIAYYSAAISIPIDLAVLQHFGIRVVASPVFGLQFLAPPGSLHPLLIAIPVFLLAATSAILVAFLPLLVMRLGLYLLAGVLWLLEFLLRLARFLAWRIIEYRKGIVTGVILVVTVILTALRILLSV
jgi:hypothetical protein